jgi:ABC-type sulfate/molybdate transport systems ATPase subunit
LQSQVALVNVSALPEVIEALRLHQLTVATPRGPVEVSVRVAPGELGAAVLAPEAGRAVARVVAGLAMPRSGRIWVGGRDVTDLPPARRQIGYVPAGGALLPHLTVRRNIGYGLRRRELVHDLSRDWVDAVIERLELGPTLELRPHHLSEAQRFRAALARAAACLPEVLVLDLPVATGAERLGDLVPLVSPPDAPGVAVLVCSADPAVLAEIPLQVQPEAVAG